MKAMVFSIALAGALTAALADDSADALKSMRQAIQKCQADIDRPKVASNPREISGKWAKSIDISRAVRFDVQTTNSLVTPVIALVEVTVESASVIADTEQSAIATELSKEPTMRGTNKMRFGWQSGQWAVLDGGRQEGQFFQQGRWGKTDGVPLPSSSVGVGKSDAARCARIILGRTPE